MSPAWRQSGPTAKKKMQSATAKLAQNCAVDTWSSRPPSSSCRVMPGLIARACARNQPRRAPKSWQGRSFGRFVGALDAEPARSGPSIAPREGEDFDGTTDRCVASRDRARSRAPALASAQEAQTEGGFALEANLGARFYSLGATTGGLPNVALPTVGLIGGYKLGRILIGLGLELSNNTSNQTMNVGVGQVSVTTSDSSFLIGPDFQAALVRTADGRVELIGDLSLHFGHQFHERLDHPVVAPEQHADRLQLPPQLRESPPACATGSTRTSRSRRRPASAARRLRSARQRTTPRRATTPSTGSSRRSACSASSDGLNKDLTPPAPLSLVRPVFS